MINLYSKVRSLMFEGSNRSKTVKKNIFFSLLLQGGTVLISLLLVPLTLHYLEATEYGIWLTLNSIFTWINVLDIGLVNGLRNKLAEALAQNNILLGQIYVSTTVALLFIIMSVVFLLVFLVNPLIDWSHLLNVTTQDATTLGSIFIIVFAFFCLQFVFKFIGAILLADQKPALNSLLSLGGSALSLLIIFIETKLVSPSLLNVALAYAASPVIIMVIAYLLLFRKRYACLRPRLKNIKFGYVKNLGGLGIQFFIVQISSTLIFLSSNIIISRMFGPQEVTPYNIAFKYFSVITLVFNIFLVPMWSAYTNAYVLKDFEWIRHVTRKLIQMWALLLGATVLMLLVSSWVYRIWLGNGIEISFTISFLMAIYATVFNWNSIYAIFLNGVGKIRLSLINSVVNMIYFIPLSYFFGKYMGNAGVILAIIATLILSSVWQPIQYRKIVSGKAYGWWNK